MASKTHFDQALTRQAHHGKKRHRPSGLESINEPKQSRVYWNVNIVKTFLDACIHEIAINGPEDGSLKAMSWKKVGEILKDRHNFFVDSKQMKSYFYGLKRKYIAWLSLKNKTKNKYDPSTNMFNLTDKAWETEMKENKWVQTLRNSPLPFPDLCAQLFDGDISIGTKRQGQSFGEHIQETMIQKDTISLASSYSYYPPFENKQIYSQFFSSGLSCFKLDPWLSTNWPPGFDRMAGPSVTQANIGQGWAFLGSARPVVLNKPTFHPVNQTAPRIDQAFTGPIRRRKNRHKPRTPTLPLPHIAIRPPGDVFLKPQAVGPLIPPSAETPVGPHEGECEVAQAQKVCSSLVEVPAELPQVHPASALNTIGTKSEEPVLPVVLNTPTFHPPNPDRAASFSFASSSSPFSFSNLVASSPSPLVGLAFPVASSSSSTTPSPTFGFGGSGSAFGLFGATSNSSGIITTTTSTLFGPTSTFGSSSMFGASSSSTTTSTAVSSPFSSGPYGSSPSSSSGTSTSGYWASSSITFSPHLPTLSGSISSSIFASATTVSSSSSAPSNTTWSPTSSFSFANVTTSTPLQSSSGLPSNLKTASATLTTTTTARKTLSFPAFDVTSLSTRSVPIFSSHTTGAASTGTSTSFLGFQTSSKTVAATTPQSTAASSFFGMESFKELKRNKRDNQWCNIAGGLSGEASFLIPPSTPPLPTTETPHKEQMVEVPPELPHVQPATACVAIDTKQPMSVFEEEMLGVLKMIADKINKPQPPSKPTFEDCEKKLNELGWPKHDPLHLVALTIFYDENDNYRELWMKLNPNLCADWVRMIGRSKRFT